MQKAADTYYFLFRNWSLDPNQWSMLLDSTAIILAVLGVCFAGIIYKRQREDAAKDAFEFFQASLPELKASISEAVKDLKQYNADLNFDKTVNPVLSVALNDQFLNKISLIDLKRFYKQKRTNRVEAFNTLLVDANFFGEYQSYISAEINQFKNNYEDLKTDFSQWRLFRSDFALSSSTVANAEQFNKSLINWKNEFDDFLQTFDQSSMDEVKNYREKNTAIVARLENLSQQISPFIFDQKEANQAFILAQDIISAHQDMMEMRKNIKKILDKDITRFENVLENLSVLLETTKKSTS